MKSIAQTVPNPIVGEISALHRQVQHLAAVKGSIVLARALVKKMEALSEQLIADEASLRDRADAQSWISFSVLALAHISKRKSEKARLLARGYALQTEAVNLRLTGPRDRAVAYAAYNLGVGLYTRLNQPLYALYFLMAARASLKHVPQKQVPLQFRLDLNASIARCHCRLGDYLKAARLLRSVISKHRPALNNASQLRSHAHCQEFLAEIIESRLP